MIAVIDYLFLYSRLPQTLNEHLMNQFYMEGLIGKSGHPEHRAKRNL